VQRRGILNLSPFDKATALTSQPEFLTQLACYTKPVFQYILLQFLIESTKLGK